jgi:hypothetical protein
MPDDKLLALAVDEVFVFVTNNHTDFTGLYANAERTQDSSSCHRAPARCSTPSIQHVIAHIERHAAQAREEPADWMLNRVVEVDDESKVCRNMPLPSRIPTRRGRPDRRSLLQTPRAHGFEARTRDLPQNQKAPVCRENKTLRQVKRERRDSNPRPLP